LYSSAAVALPGVDQAYRKHATEDDASSRLHISHLLDSWSGVVALDGCRKRPDAFLLGKGSHDVTPIVMTLVVQELCVARDFSL